MKASLLLVALVAVCSAAWPVCAQTLFFDDFESGLSAWHTYYGETVSSPVDPGTHGMVIHFTANMIGGDAMTLEGLSLTPGETYHFTLDYLGLSTDAGGYAGISSSPLSVPNDGMWVLDPSSLVNDGQWHSYEFEFTAPWFGFDTVWLALEQVYGLEGAAYFDNIRLRGQDPDPSVCCVGETCFLVLAEECAAMQGVFHPEWSSCGSPNPCEVPSPNRPESWGGVKSLYR